MQCNGCIIKPHFSIDFFALSLGKEMTFFENFWNRKISVFSKKSYFDIFREELLMYEL